MNITGLYQVIVLALAVAGISVTISKSRGFYSLRRWIAKHNTFLGDIVSCSYCMNILSAIVFVAIYRPVLIQMWIVIDLFVSLLGVIAIAAIISGIIVKLTSFHGSDSNNSSNSDNSTSWRSNK